MPCAVSAVVVAAVVSVSISVVAVANAISFRPTRSPNTRESYKKASNKPIFLCSLEPGPSFLNSLNLLGTSSYGARRTGKIHRHCHLIPGHVGKPGNVE